MRDISAIVRIEQGQMTERNRAKVIAAVRKAKDGEYILTLERVHAKMSPAQRRYYFSVIVDAVARHLKVTPKVAHSLLKAQFLPRELAMTGENGTLIDGLVIGGSLTKLNKLQTIEYFERIVMWAAEKWHLYIEDPDPNWRAHAEHAAAKEDPRDTMRREKAIA